MPEGTRVHKIYEALLKKGYDRGRAAAIAQTKTKQSLHTGKSLKGKKRG